MMQLKRNPALAAAFAAAIALTGCGGDDAATGTGATSANTSGFPRGLAIASLTEALSATTNLSTRSLTTGPFAMLLQPGLRSRQLTPLQAGTALQAGAGAGTKKQHFEQLAAGTNGCAVRLGGLKNLRSANCYGPQLYYVNHPDGGGTASGQLPSGDLGLWDATEGGSVACAAAQNNSISEAVNSRADEMLNVAGAMRCVVNQNSLSMPEANSTLTLTTELQSALGTNNTGVTISSATIARGADDANGNATYTYSVTATEGSTGEISLNMRHTSTATDNSTYTGKAWGSFSGYGNNPNIEAFSLDYANDGTDIDYRMVSASYGTSTQLTDIFNNTTNDIIETTAFQGNMQYVITNMNPETGVGATHSAWQAGSGDGEMRVLQVYTTSNSGTLTMNAFFGFGTGVSSSAGYTLNQNSRMICNWAGPGNGRTGLANTLQKQTAQANATTGVFDTNIVSNITYSPSNTCSHTATNFNYGLTASPTAPAAAVTHNMVNITTDTEYQAFPTLNVPNSTF